MIQTLRRFMDKIEEIGKACIGLLAQTSLPKGLLAAASLTLLICVLAGCSGPEGGEGGGGTTEGTSTPTATRTAAPTATSTPRGDRVDTSSRADAQKRKRDPKDTLLVWAGDQAHQAPDFIAVVDFEQASHSYGKVLGVVPLSGRGAVGNEPHHVGISKDGKVLALGGLLSVLRGQDQVFFFDMTDPRHPVFIHSDNPPHASIADEFDPLNNGGFMATFMGGADGANPGRGVEYDEHQNFVQSWPANPPTDGFNPHGVSIDEAHNLMVTSDFICPLHTLNIPGGGGVTLRGSVRVWNLANRSITRTVTVGDPSHPAGTIDVKLIPGDRKLRAFTAGMADNHLYLVDTRKGTATPVFDFSSFAISNAPVWPQLIRINRDGTRLFITLNYAGAAGKVVMLNIERPKHPKLVDVVNLGNGSGPHYLQLSRDEKRLVVSDYFLVEDLSPGGVVRAEGDHKIHVIKVGPNRMSLDDGFDLDFNRDISTGPARPHGLVTIPAAKE